MKTVLARYEVGIEGESLEHFRLWSDASMRASVIGGYVYDRMARIGKPQLWQAVNGDLIVQSVRLPNGLRQTQGSLRDLQGESTPQPLPTSQAVFLPALALVKQ